MINIEHNIASVGFLDNKQAHGAYSRIITSLIFWASTAVEKCYYLGKMFPKIILTCVAGGRIQIVTSHIFFPIPSLVTPQACTHFFQVNIF